ncbi:MAG: 30S ribosomal protein S7 [Lentisphaerales bacterium]|jgi:small subunit ribosomal protein S7|nr:MAG: 30S ribosomal protein S7 [Lentisphaerales bacterium]
MSRRRRAVRRDFTPDPKYGSELVAHLINQVMICGKKSVAERIVYGALQRIEKAKEGQDPLEVLVRGVDNVKPRVEVKSRRVGGATYQVPIEVRPSRQRALALRWIIQFASARKGMPTDQALATELLDAFGNQGNAIKKKEDTHKMAQANKAFAHYRW